MSVSWLIHIIQFTHFLSYFSICTSNLSDFSKSPSLNNFGPNLTVIFIPGSLNCPDQARARQVNNKQFGIELSQVSFKIIISDQFIKCYQDSEEVETGSPSSSNNFDCGQTVSPNDQEISCGEHASSFTKTPENSQCLWHFNVKYTAIQIRSSFCMI